MADKNNLFFLQRTLRPWLNWIEHLTTDQKVEGSNPSGRARNLTARNGGLIYVQFPPGLAPPHVSTSKRICISINNDSQIKIALMGDF